MYISFFGALDLISSLSKWSENKQEKCLNYFKDRDNLFIDYSMMGQKLKYSEILPPLIAFHLIIAATSWLSTGFSFRISWTLLVSIEFTTVSTFLTSFSAFSWFFWISCFFRLTKVSRKLMHANSTKAVNTKVSHTNKSKSEILSIMIISMAIRVVEFSREG